MNRTETNSEASGHSENPHRDSRRGFLKTLAAGTVASGFTTNLPASDSKGIVGANDRVRIGVVGIRGMGYGHVKAYSRLKNVEVAAVCDVDENIIDARLSRMEEDGIPKPKTFVDLRKLLDESEIDAISVATPNHWQSLAAFWAVQAGKHAAIEKPGTHNIFEGQQLIKASRKYNRLIQHHAERRVFPGFKSAVDFLQSGGLGEVYMAKGLCYKWRRRRRSQQHAWLRL